MKKLKSEYMIEFSKNLNSLVKTTTVADLSAGTGISHQAIYRYLKCTREITLENLCKIADYFDEDLNFLVGRKQY